MNLIKNKFKKKKIDWIIFDYETALSRKNGWRVDIDILYLELCEVYGWSWQEFLETPPYIINIALAKLTTKRKVENKKSI